VREVRVQVTITAPREPLFDFVADLAGRPAWTDHYLRDFRLASGNPEGVGAAARFRLRAPLAREYAEIAIVEAERPRRIVEQARVGRRGRNRAVAVYEFVPEAGGATRVELTTYLEPATIVDRLKQVGAAGWMRRKTGTALRRLRSIFEDGPTGPLARATVAGWEPHKAPRFGTSVGYDPSRPSEPRATESGARGG
jgi:uncharacterized protein YndB with AHSA1/START domain